MTFAFEQHLTPEKSVAVWDCVNRAFGRWQRFWLRVAIGVWIAITVGLALGWAGESGMCIGFCGGGMGLIAFLLSSEKCYRKRALARFRTEFKAQTVHWRISEEEGVVALTAPEWSISMRFSAFTGCLRFPDLVFLIYGPDQQQLVFFRADFAREEEFLALGDLLQRHLPAWKGSSR